jgi:hypothetical protein
MKPQFVCASLFRSFVASFRERNHNGAVNSSYHAELTSLANVLFSTQWPRRSNVASDQLNLTVEAMKLEAE